LGAELSGAARSLELADGIESLHPYWGIVGLVEVTSDEVDSPIPSEGAGDSVDA
jgi:hypothetical protein